MIKKLFQTIILSVMLASTANAQDENKYNLDVLRAPSSPAAKLIGITSEEIERPSDVSSFMVSLQNATENFSKLPNKYAVDFAPAWVFRGDKITYNDYISPSFKNSFWQSFVISTAINSSSDDVKTDLGLGIKFSACRGNISDKTKTQINNSTAELKKILPNITINQQELEADSIYIQYKNIMRNIAQNHEDFNTRQDYLEAKVKAEERLALLKDKKIDAFKNEDEEHKESFERLKKIAEEIDWRRVGFKLDFAGGTAINFPTNVFSLSYVTKAGAWMTFGYDAECGFSALGIIRYLYHPDQEYITDDDFLSIDNLNSFDGGTTLLYNKPDSKFTFKGEILYRKYMSNSDISTSWRYTINPEYEIKKNTKLTLTLGRDFDGIVSKSGTLLALLNIVMGFGNNRSVQ